MGIEALIAALPEIIGGGAEAAGAGLGLEAGAAGAAADVAGAAGAGAGAAGAADIATLAGAGGPSVLGTAADFLTPATSGIAGLGGAPTVLGTAADTFAVPSAVGGAAEFGGAADLATASQFGSAGLTSTELGIGAGGNVGDLVASGGFPGAQSLPANVANANASAIAPTAAGTPSTAPSLIPQGGGGAASLAGPTGATPVDATSFVGNSSVGGAPLSGQPGVTPAPAAGGGSTGISDLLGKAGQSISSNPLGIALGAAGLGYNILSGSKLSSNEKKLQSSADIAAANSAQEVASGNALQQYLTSGTLPPNYQTIVDNAIADAKTNAISQAAAQGQSTDPLQNSALAATLAKIDTSRATMQTQVAQSLFSSGSSLLQTGTAQAGLSGQLFQALVANDTTQAANTGKAIATLAAALAGKSQAAAGGQTITIGAA